MQVLGQFSKFLSPAPFFSLTAPDAICKISLPQINPKNLETACERPNENEYVYHHALIPFPSSTPATHTKNPSMNNLQSYKSAQLHICTATHLQANEQQSPLPPASSRLTPPGTHLSRNAILQIQKRQSNLPAGVGVGVGVRICVGLLCCIEE